MAVADRTGRRPVGGLHPGVRATSPGPALVQELGDLRELVHGEASPSGNSSSSGARSPTFARTRSRPSSRSHTESAAKLPAERVAGAERRGPPGLAWGACRRHPLRQLHHGPQPSVLTHHSRLGIFTNDSGHW